MSMTVELEAGAQTIPDAPRWVENYALDAYDAERDFGYFMHFGRWTPDPRIWCEKLYIALPGGVIGVQHNYGARPSATAAKGALLDIEVGEPGKILHFRYTGPVRCTTSAELLAGHLTDKPRHLLQFDLTFTGTGEIWDFGATDSGADAFHIEQPGKLTGSVVFDGKTIQVNGVGYRDHSRGTRSLAKLVDGVWMHGTVGDRSFAIYATREFRDGKVEPKIDRAVVWDKGRQYVARPVMLPFLKSSNAFNGYGGTYAVTLRSDLGDMHIDARILRTMVFSYDGESNEFLIGSVSGDYVIFEEVTEFRWNGQVGYGNTERALRRTVFPAG